METIVEENDNELKMYERESMQKNQNSNTDEINRTLSKSSQISDSLDSKSAQNRYTSVDDSLFNVIEQYQEENEKELNKNEQLNNDKGNEKDKNEVANNGNDINVNLENGINDNAINDNNITQKPKNKINEYKIIILGDYGVGKTRLIYRYCNYKFIDDSNGDIEYPEISKKIITLDENLKVKIYIWDTAGQEQTGTLFKKYYIDSYGVLIAFDLTNKTSFANLKKWVKIIKDNCPKDIVLCFVGTKSDLVNEREVEYEKIKDFVNENLYYEVSAKSGNNVSLAFEQLIYNIVEKQNEEEGNPNKVLRGKEGRKTTDLHDFYYDKDLKKNNMCC